MGTIPIPFGNLDDFDLIEIVGRESLLVRTSVRRAEDDRIIVTWETVYVSLGSVCCLEVAPAK